MQMNISIDTFNQYTRLKSIGQGSFSVVFHVIKNDTNQSYAMKILSSKFNSIEQIRNNEEICLMSHVGQHPNIVSLHDIIFEPSNGRLSLVMDLMDQNVLQYMQMERKGKLSVQESLIYTYQLLNALSHVHSRGVIHRDIKPENIFINPQKNELKLGDFGSARNLISNKPLTEYVATRWYRPPECLMTSGVYGPPLDVWAVGCILYELLTGVPLFPGKNQIDQLNRIHRLLGSPTPEILEKLCPANQLKDLSFLKFDPPRSEFERRLPGVAKEVIDLLKKLLTYLPSERITAADALNHDAFHCVLQGNKIIKSIVISSEPYIDCVGIPSAMQQEEPLTSRIRDDTGVLQTATRKPKIKIPQIIVPRNQSFAKAQVRRKLITTPPKMAQGGINVPPLARTQILIGHQQQHHPIFKVQPKKPEPSELGPLSKY
ncbi:putative protein kinase [Tritrichomonas foetus]|uniref:Protein kinase domain-containing protein n=1 Tax=Tritrichomonas foetus TaxID=1144522 RepID=A0A1J4KBI1_9EUKA|nr:putative protein kinase [Tritrichomonas foetus]|eukprot:OHT07046.1 putative protein kinase [Tritrichomonas foetus]